MTERRRTVVCWPCVRSVAATAWRPLRPVPANEAVLESGRHAGEALSFNPNPIQPKDKALWARPRSAYGLASGRIATKPRPSALETAWWQAMQLEGRSCA